MDESELKLLKAQRRDPQSSDVRGVLRFLSERGISAWVHGGWAVEGLVGKPLSHQDVDLFVPLEQRQRLEETLGDRLVVRDKSHVVWNHNFVQIDIVFFLTYKKIVLLQPIVISYGCFLILGSLTLACYSMETKFPLSIPL
jgi:hypothetical protein